MLATTVYDSRLDEPEVDNALIVTIVAAAPLLRIELQAVVSDGSCALLAQHDETWPTFVRVRSPERTIEVALTEHGPMRLEHLVRGPKQFVYGSKLEPSRRVRTEWLHI